MREIKFRAWDKDIRKMIIPDDIARIHMNPLPFGLTVMVKGGDGMSMKFELMQYTGLKDSTGKEIYEGDIIIDNDGVRAQIKWDEGYLGWIVRSRRYMGWEPLSRFYVPHIKIIGNIYENPELLEEKK